MQAMSVHDRAPHQTIVAAAAAAATTTTPANGSSVCLVPRSAKALRMSRFSIFAKVRQQTHLEEAGAVSRSVLGLDVGEVRHVRGRL